MSLKHTRTDIKKNAMIVALEATLGVVTLACKKAGVSRSQHYEWLNTDENYKKRVESVADMALDFVESKLYEKIKSEDTTSIIFYLKTKGKRRGYIEHTSQNISLTGEDGSPVIAKNYKVELHI